MTRTLGSAAILFCAAAALAATQSGTVVGVTDGDTIRVLTTAKGRKEELRVRLHGIDCPETKQPYAAVAKRFVSDAVYRKPVTVDVRGKDRYGRTVGWVTYRDAKKTHRELNFELVRAGLAWWYERYAPRETKLRGAQESARKARRGLWADPRPVAPWDWKRLRRGG